MATFTRTCTTSSTIPHRKIIHSVQLHRNRNILWLHRKARTLVVSVSSPANAQATLEVCSVLTNLSDLRSNDTNNTARHKHFLRNNRVSLSSRHSRLATFTRRCTTSSTNSSSLQSFTQCNYTIATYPGSIVSGP